VKILDLESAMVSFFLSFDFDSKIERLIIGMEFVGKIEELLRKNYNIIGPNK
jgi:ribosome-associated toxin RatA of RatAB toxin-antitoxin module